MNMHHTFAVGLLAVLGSACATEIDGDEVLTATGEGAIGESSCGTAKADFVAKLSRNRNEVALPGALNGLVSPTTYDNPNCDKAYVIDLVNNPFHDIRSNIPMEVVYNGPRGTLLGQPTEEIPVDGATCRTIRMRAIRYENTFSFPGTGGGVTPGVRVIDNVTESATFTPVGEPPPFPNQQQRGICRAPRKIPLRATPPGLGEKLAIQVLQGNTTLSVKLQARQ